MKEDSMATKPLPDQALLLKLLRYEPETGKLFWLPRPLEMFSDHGIGAELNCRNWNRRYANREAFPCASPKGAKGYVQAQIFRGKYQAHRIIWKMVTGEEPDQIDHISGIRADNRFSNLRAVSCAENKRNLGIDKRNKSGCTGVLWHKAAGKWWASIQKDGQRHNLGLYENLENAVRARKAAERRLGFHPNHGRIARPESRP